jgi:hypothetical protein
MAWGLSRDGYRRFPAFLSVPYIWACSSGQQSPLIVASILIGALGWLAPIKPNLGLASIACRPSRISVFGSAAFVILLFGLNAHWLTEWLETLPYRLPGVYRAPILTLGGPAILLAALRWRRPEARLLLVLALVPQNLLFYDQLLLWLVPRTWKESALLTCLSFPALFLGNTRIAASGMRVVVDSYAPLIVAFLFLPCVIMILRRPNEGGAFPRQITSETGPASH